VDTYVGREHLHGGTVHVRLPRNSLSKPEWAVTNDNQSQPVYDTDTGTPGGTAILSVECDEQKINPGDKISFCIYKKGTIPNGINKTHEGIGEKEPDKSKAECNWYYKYEDTDYPAINNTGPSYFFEAYSNCMDVVTSGKEFTTKWLRIDDVGLNLLERRLINKIQQEQQAQQQQQLQQNIITITRLQDLFHNKTDILARIIYNNSNALDADSQVYLKKFSDPEAQILSILNDITVYGNIPSQIMASAFASVGLPPNRFLEALSIGDHIYTNGDSNPPLVPPTSRNGAALLGHEAIHSIQARAFKTSGAPSEQKARFITFCANNAYKAETNRYEEAAYRFDGKAEPDFYLEQTGRQRQAPSMPILEDPNISVFW
jgi:hypothetical protein